MKVLVIGCGSIGQRHIRNLVAVKAGEVMAFDIDPRKLIQVKEVCPSVRTFSDLKECWAERPQAAVIALPTSLHIRYALEAAQQGVDLLIEKPISHERKDVDGLLDVIRKKRLVSFVAYNYRFSDYLLRAQELLRSKRLGRFISGRSHFGSYLPERHPWEDYRKGYGARKELGGGPVLDTISHQMDYWMFLLGKPKEVFAWADKRSKLDIDVEDTVEVTARFRSGETVSMHANFVERPVRNRIEIIGDNGTYAGDIAAKTAQVFDVKSRQWQPLRVEADFNVYYVREIKDFLERVKSRKAPETDAVHGAEALKVLLKIKESVKKKKWVNV